MSLTDVLGRVGDAADRAGRDSAEITVVAVSKSMSVEQIQAVYDQGHRDFGENRAQEMADKAKALPSDIRWHFVGALQSRKARLVRPSAHLLHSMDRGSLAAAWLKGHGHAPPVLVQVNIAGEEQKSGMAPESVSSAIAGMRSLGLDIVGLMSIPPAPHDPEDSRPHFRRMRELRDQLAAEHPYLSELSMGMTDDFEVAIAEGASIIRVGRAIFGPRNATGA